MIAFPNTKVNLGLSILRRRSDGFHDLETVFVPYWGFRDKLEIVEAKGHENSIRIIGGAIGDGSSDIASDFLDCNAMVRCDWDPARDLCIRAWELLNHDFGIPPVDIVLEKHSPVGAGLGGGSADAAFALQAYNELFGLQLGTEALALYATRLGSDCSFFLHNRPMFGSGRGEKLCPFELDLSAYELKVFIPKDISVGTAEAYSRVIPRDKWGIERRGIDLRTVLAMPIEQWREHLVNDFELSVFAAHPEIGTLKAKLYDQGAVYASMSGSGSAVFGLFAKNS